MPRVKCPHCGAGNQDAAEQDTCWQCGNVLGAPVTRPEPAAAPMRTISAPTQQLDPTLLRDLPSAARRSNEAAQRRMAVALTLALLLIGLLVILLFVLAVRRP